MCRRRPSSAWFDDECRKAKQLVHSLERDVRRAGELSAASPSMVAAWCAQRYQYVQLHSRKCAALWISNVDADQSQPRRLGQSFSELLRRGRSPPSAIAATDLHLYFDDKVADVRATTADANPPTFTSAPTGCQLRVFCQPRKLA